MSTTTIAPSTLLKKSLGWVIALSVVMIIAGILAVIMPPIAGIAITVLFGWLLTFSGVAHLAYAWQTRGTGAILWELLLGAAYLFAGIYTLLHPLLSCCRLRWCSASTCLSKPYSSSSSPYVCGPWLARDGSSWMAS